MKEINDFIEYLQVIKKDSNYTLDSYEYDLKEYYNVVSKIIDINKNDVNKYLEYLYNKKYNRT